MTRERRRPRVLAAERARQAVEIDAAELDEVRPQPPAPHHLGAQRRLDLFVGQQAIGDE